MWSEDSLGFYLPIFLQAAATAWGSDRCPTWSPATTGHMANHGISLIFMGWSEAWGWGKSTQNEAGSLWVLPRDTIYRFWVFYFWISKALECQLGTANSLFYHYTGPVCFRENDIPHRYRQNWRVRREEKWSPNNMLLRSLMHQVERSISTGPGYRSRRSPLLPSLPSYLPAFPPSLPHSFFPFLFFFLCSS